MAKKFKFCCPALELACNRASINQRIGIQTGSVLSISGRRVVPDTVVVIYFPKAKKGDESKYGFKSKFKDTTYGLCNYCPFCGTRLEQEAKETKAAGEGAVATASRPTRKRGGRVPGSGEKPGPVQPTE